MENIKKFEKYKMDIEGGEIAEEYVKYIVSKYIDSYEDTTLEEVYVDLVKRDDLDETQADIIRHELLSYTASLYNEAKKVRNILTINAEKYNL